MRTGILVSPPKSGEGPATPAAAAWRPLTMKMKKAKDRQITFYADPDVYEWLKQQESVTRFLNTLIRSHMSNGQNAEVAKAAGSQLKTPRSDEHANQFMPEVTSTRALSSMVNE